MSTKFLTRREFLRLAVIASSGLVLNACAPSATPTTAPTTAPTAVPTKAPSVAPTTAPTTASVAAPTTAPTARPTTAPTPSAQQPQSGGVLTCKISADPPNFDPISNTTSSLLIAVAPCYSNLVRFDPMNPDKVIGDLAEKWETSSDGKTLTFKLIPGVKFHDGKPLTSEDVKYTFDIVRDPPAGVTSARKGSLGVVEKIEAPDATTVRFILKSPSPSLLNTLASGWMPVIPKHVHQAKGNLQKDVVGSGPFKLKEYIRGVSVELVKNPDYHVKGHPYLDGIKVFIVPDPSTAYANFRAGQILLYDEIQGVDAKRAVSEMGDKIVMQTVPALSSEGMSLNTRRKPWDDIRMRQAVSLAVDREEAITVVMSGEAVVGGPIPPGIWALPTAELEKIDGFGKNVEANRAKAKKLLADAGYPNGLSVTLIARKAAGTHEARAVFIKDQLAKVGIDVKVNIQESATYFDSIQKGTFDIATTQSGGLANDPDPLFADYYLCAGSVNYAGACSKELDELFIKQSQTLDVEARKKLVNQMELQALNLQGFQIWYWKSKFMIYSKRVHNLLLHSQADNNRQLQDVWLSKD